VSVGEPVAGQHEIVHGAVASLGSEDRAPASAGAPSVMATLLSLLNGPTTPGWTLVEGSGAVAAIGADDDVERWPLVLSDGAVVGVVERHGPRHDIDDVVLALVRASVALVAAEARADEAATRAALADQESRMDPLTGLGNRRAWELALVHEQARCRRTGQRAAIVVVDLDGLKEANDADGHLAGDLLLRRAGLAIQGALRETDFVARMGGDEFGVLAVSWELDGPEALVERVAAALEHAEVAASVGGSVPEFGESLLSAFHRADVAMYRAKAERRARREAPA
jgi:diguanylate cyclase (GGDEF)-like protein